MVNQDKVVTRQLIKKWHEKAQIDYSDLYVKEYIAYNAWFRKVTDCATDYEAIRRVTKRFVIWDDYIHGRTLVDLGQVADMIAEFTHRYPIRLAAHSWNGVVADSFDWKNLIFFWYQTRCDLFHGLTMPGKIKHDIQIELAYKSLNIFMTEIIRRMRHCFSDEDYVKLTEVQALLKSPNGSTDTLQKTESGLYQKFIHSPDLWNVDMQRV